MTRIWRDYWNDYPRGFPESEFLRQVGKTVGGRPISKQQLSQILQDVIDKLNVLPSDSVLDLCCGNGLITSAVAQKCASITGIDFSKPLIEIALKYHCPKNAHYSALSVFDITPQNIGTPIPFSKIYMYEALQYFAKPELPRLMDVLMPLCERKTTLVFFSVPDRARIWKFYNTPERKLEYEVQRRAGAEPVGTWWSVSTIRRTCARYGLACEFLDQPEALHTAHYRFDVRMAKP